MSEKKICKRCGKDAKSGVEGFCADCWSINSKIENNEGCLNTVSVIILIFGIIFSVILFFIAIINTENTTFDVTGFAFAIVTFLFSMLLYSLMQLVIGTSKNVRHMANKHVDEAGQETRPD